MSRRRLRGTLPPLAQNDRLSRRRLSVFLTASGAVSLSMSACVCVCDCLCSDICVSACRDLCVCLRVCVGGGGR